LIINIAAVGNVVAVGIGVIINHAAAKGGGGEKQGEGFHMGFLGK
jgi:hypothetical protein